MPYLVLILTAIVPLSSELVPKKILLQPTCRREVHVHLCATDICIPGFRGIEHGAQIRNHLRLGGKCPAPNGEDGPRLLVGARDRLPLAIRPSGGEVVAKFEWLIRDACRPRGGRRAQQKPLEVDMSAELWISKKITILGRYDGSIPAVLQEQGRLRPGVEIFSLYLSPPYLVSPLIPARLCLPDHELHVQVWVGRKREQHPLAQPPGLVLGLVDGLGRHTAQASDQAAASGEVKLPIKPARAAPDAVVLAAAHQDEDGDLETLAVGPGLVSVAGFARSAEVEVPRLERGRAVRDVDGALAVVALVADVAEPFFLVAAADARDFVDNFGLAA